MSKVDEILTRFADIDLASYPFYEIRDLIRSLGKNVFVVYTLSPGKIITRARTGGDFSEISELSYLPQEKNKECKRASTPNRTMFYGTILQEGQPLEENRLIAASECSSLLRGGKETFGTEKITFGRWVVTKDINLIVILDDSIYNSVSNNPLLSNLKEAFDNFIKTSTHNKENVSQISRFLAKEFSKDQIHHDYNYFISAIFSEMATNDLGYDGVMYPSVQSGGQLGFNVAIKPFIVENNLRLDIVAESTLNKKGDQSFIFIDRISGMSTWKYLDSPQLNIKNIMELLHITSLDELNK